MERKEAKEKLKALCPILQAAGITCVTADYSGEGDSGAVEEARAWKTYDDEEALFPDGVDEDEFAELFEAFLDEGWEINEGEHGTFKLNVLVGRVEVDRTVHTEQYDSHDLDL